MEVHAMEELFESWMTEEEKDAIRKAATLLAGSAFEVRRRPTLEDIHPADREYSSPYRNRYGDKVTASGYAWEERMCDPDYHYALTHASEPSDPADWDDDN